MLPRCSTEAGQVWCPPKTVETEEDALNTLIWAAEANEGLPELTLRTLHYLRTGDYPNRPVEVMEALLQSYLPVPALGEEQAEVAQQAHDLALTTLLQSPKQPSWKATLSPNRNYRNLSPPSCHLKKVAHRSSKESCANCFRIPRFCGAKALHCG